jgi:hypothetical protein
MLTYVIVLVIGLAGGAACVFVLIGHRERSVRELQQRAETIARQNEQTRNELAAQQKQLASMRSRADLEHRTRLEEFKSKEERLHREIAAFNAKVVTYTDLQNENATLKQDLRNLDIGFRKLELDRDVQRKRQHELDERGKELAERYLKDNVRWINSLLGSNNYAICKQRLLDVIARCREIGFDVPDSEEQALLADLQAGFEKAVRLALEREEQARIKARLREEQRLEREIARELQQAETAKQAIEDALAEALKHAQDLHSAEIESLRSRLAEAEARSARAVAMAELTKAGNVYVISNVGSFGESVYKIGMTRRLEPMDRVRELGDASVPFPFDVHMMISCEDAPKLENALHRELHTYRVNHMNPRKEFFRIDIETIRKLVEKYHGTVEYVADAEALEYRQSLNMSEEDQEFIEHVYESMPDEHEDLEIDSAIE